MFGAYNNSTSTFIEFPGSVETDSQCVDYLWNNHIIRSDDDLKYWTFWPVAKSFRVEVEVTYNFKEE